MQKLLFPALFNLVKKGSKAFGCIVFIIASAVQLYAQEEIYEWSSLPFGGAGFVTGIITCPQEEGLMYARTDVGGAYRWNPQGESWIPITDFLPENQAGLMGVESLAIDPSSPNKVYLYCGTSYWNGGLSAILYSEDYGESFTQVATVTGLFPAHGNDLGRQSGERLAVCPRGGKLLLCGSRTRGLWKSENAGKNWKRIASDCFVNDRKISFVQFIDSVTVVAGLLYRGGDNLFMSRDGGATWNAVENAPTDYMPHRCRLAPDGRILYIAYSDSEGPGTNGSGALMKLDLATSAWSDISPQPVSFGDISVAGDNPDHLMAVSMGIWWGQYWKSGVTTWGDQIWVSKNGGKTWTCLMESGRSTYSEPLVTWMKSQCHLHWCGSAQMDPFNSGKVYFVSGNGIVCTHNLWASRPTFKMCVTGLEETVPLNIVSVTGAPLAVAIGDYDGCLYTDITRYYSRYSPSMGSTSAIAIAARNPKVMLRGAGDIYYSSNGGRTWVKKNKPVSDAGISSCALSAEGTMLVARPSGKKPYYSVDGGKNWKEISDSPSGTDIFADPVSDCVFYGMNNGVFYVYIYDPATDSFATTKKNIGNVVGRMCVVDGISGEVWLPRGTNGLAHLSGCDTGTPVIKNITMSSCTCVGAGKAREEGGYPSLYIWGRKNAAGKIGLYRSDDSGVRWTRINDDRHQFGGPGNAQIVSGDMNEYGRVYMSTVGRGVITGKLVVDTENAIEDISAIAPSTKRDDIYSVYNTEGKLVNKTYDYRAAVSSLGSGIYIVKGKNDVRKIIK